MVFGAVTSRSEGLARMERTIISFNVPNLITVNLMAWIGFLVFIFLFQMVFGRKGLGQSATRSDSGAADY